MAETVRMICPNLQCQSILAVPVTARGKTIRCSGCGTTIRVPSNSPKPADSGASTKPS